MRSLLRNKQPRCLNLNETLSYTYCTSACSGYLKLKFYKGRSTRSAVPDTRMPCARRQPISRWIRCTYYTMPLNQKWANLLGCSAMPLVPKPICPKCGNCVAKQGGEKGETNNPKNFHSSLYRPAACYQRCWRVLTTLGPSVYGT